MTNRRQGLSDAVAEALGEALRQIRLIRGMTQAQVERSSAGASTFSALSRNESGNRFPTLRTMRGLTYAYRMKMIIDPIGDSIHFVLLDLPARDMDVARPPRQPQAGAAGGDGGDGGNQLFASQFGAELRRIRLARGFSLSQASVLSQDALTASAIPRLESGRRSASLRSAITLARVYRIWIVLGPDLSLPTLVPAENLDGQARAKLLDTTNALLSVSLSE
jgi:transcriptional regulator with XRE-family HTH domain